MPEVTNGHICFSLCSRIRAFIARWPQRTPIIKHFNIILNRLLCSVDFHISCWKFPAIALVLEGEISYLTFFLLNGLCIFSPQLWTWRSMTDNIYDVYSITDPFYFGEFPKSIGLTSHTDKKQFFLRILHQPSICFSISITRLALHIF